MPTPHALLASILPLLACLILAGCDGATAHSSSYSIEERIDGAGDPVLVYEADVTASDPAGSLCTVTVGLVGAWDGQWSGTLMGERTVTLMVTTTDGTAFEDVSFRMKPPAERPLVFGDDDFGGYAGNDSVTDASGAVLTRWIWQIEAMPTQLGMVQGYPSLDCSIGDYEFMLNDAQVRGMTDYLRRLKNQGG